MSIITHYILFVDADFKGDRTFCGKGDRAFCRKGRSFRSQMHSDGCGGGKGDRSQSVIDWKKYLG
ncbi:MAG: hypothetical protein P2A85_22400 [Microcoleus anatoxicus]|uniref:hypothetical protein n=1 Tax=Microcoleus anatoxicus TaxID=2705319 RepID=UPI00366C4861